MLFCLFVFFCHHQPSSVIFGDWLVLTTQYLPNQGVEWAMDYANNIYINMHILSHSFQSISAEYRLKHLKSPFKKMFNSAFIQLFQVLGLFYECPTSLVSSEASDRQSLATSDCPTHISTWLNEMNSVPSPVRLLCLVHFVLSGSYNPNTDTEVYLYTVLLLVVTNCITIKPKKCRT